MLIYSFIEKIVLSKKKQYSFKKLVNNDKYIIKIDDNYKQRDDKVYN